MTAEQNADPALVAVLDHLLTVGRQKLWSMVDELLAVLATKGQTPPDPLDGVVAVILRFTTGPQGTPAHGVRAAGPRAASRDVRRPWAPRGQL